MANGKFVGYYRVSTKSQGASGLGLEAQSAAVLSYLNGGSWALLAAYTDIETGTRKGNQRPELKKAIAHAKRERATLVIAKLDRLARNVNFVTSLMESGVEFVCVDNPTANKLTVQILACVAEAEAEAISKRTKEALAAAKARGVVLGTPENLTADAQKKGAAAREAKAISTYVGVARTIADLRKGGSSFQQIATSLNDSGEVTTTGLPFKAMTVKRILDRVTQA